MSKFEDGTWTTYTTADGLADNYVNDIAIDEAGDKWFGTSGGVSMFDDSTWTTYTTTHGLADNAVVAIAVDGSGHYWFGTEDGGLNELFFSLEFTVYLPITLRGWR